MPTYSIQVRGNVISLGEKQITIPNIIANSFEEACAQAKAMVVTNLEVIAGQKTAD